MSTGNTLFHSKFINSLELLDKLLIIENFQKTLIKKVNYSEIMKKQSRKNSAAVYQYSRIPEQLMNFP